MIKFLGTAQKNNRVVLYYLQDEDGTVFFKAATSKDSFEFKESNKYVFALDVTQKEEQTYDWDKFRITKGEDQYILTYKNKKDAKSPALIAISTDLNVWYKIGEIKDIYEASSIVPSFKHNNSYVMFYGEKEVKLAYSKSLVEWETKETLLKPRADLFDSAGLEVANAYIVEDKILLIYYSKNEEDKNIRYVGAAFFEKDNPEKLVWRSDRPIYELPNEYHHENVKPIGTALIDEQLILYWSINDSNIFSVSTQIPKITHDSKWNIFSFLVKKSHKNPIISPRSDVPWESRATFNSAAILEDEKVHFLYRALGDKDLSVLGYATSQDGTHIDFRSDTPAYIPREPFETPGGNRFNSIAAHFISGGGYGGIEDPRITRIEDKIYLTYVAFDGANPPRVAMSNIDIKDFLNNNWDNWSTPKLISAPGMVNKSAVVFPRKINDKYVMMHRVYPNILIDYLEDLEFNDYLKGHHFIPPRKSYWDSKKVGAGAPPIETEDGWLLIYQSVGYQDPSRYKIGAMMLDIDNPSKVLYRTHEPIIEPNEHYENNGFKAGVVYPCGAVVMNDNLNIYYGGSDSYLCAASADLKGFLKEMKNNKEPKVQAVSGAFFD
jgi:beta-1,2-mannobiose phosphorylase / 1,2-beta-oligomannan phosphorylase